MDVHNFSTRQFVSETCLLSQVFKFGCYISIPILMTVFVAGDPARLESIIRNVRFILVLNTSSPYNVERRELETAFTVHGGKQRTIQTDPISPHVQRAYVVYPPEGPRPPSAEELMERVKKSKQQ